ncbi:hypothetical protein [Sorangium sp. So ce1099]|uniref:hypothetical protein n=1 Tax=Sorangium sp. So ce1099 TaxID=3133331 RepID=UPI003F63C1D4
MVESFQVVEMDASIAALQVDAPGNAARFALPLLAGHPGIECRTLRRRRAHGARPDGIRSQVACDGFLFVGRIADPRAN